VRRGLLAFGAVLLALAFTSKARAVPVRKPAPAPPPKPGRGHGGTSYGGGSQHPKWVKVTQGELYLLQFELEPAWAEARVKEAEAKGEPGFKWPIEEQTEASRATARALGFEAEADSPLPTTPLYVKARALQTRAQVVPYHFDKPEEHALSLAKLANLGPPIKDFP
jgi:hypothetical protein